MEPPPARNHCRGGQRRCTRRRPPQHVPCAPGQILGEIGTSTCHVMNGEVLRPGPRDVSRSPRRHRPAPGSGAAKPVSLRSATSSRGSPVCVRPGVRTSTRLQRLGLRLAPAPDQTSQHSGPSRRTDSSSSTGTSATGRVLVDQRALGSGRRTGSGDACRRRSIARCSRPPPSGHGASSRRSRRQAFPVRRVRRRRSAPQGLLPHRDLRRRDAPPAVVARLCARSGARLSRPCSRSPPARTRMCSAASEVIGQRAGKQSSSLIRNGPRRITFTTRSTAGCTTPSAPMRARSA